MFERYPDFRIEVYATHPDFANQDRMVEKVRWNATNTVLSNGVESISNFTGCVAFPIPEGAEEVLWNSRTNGCMTSYHVLYDGYAVFPNGDRAHDAIDFYQSNPFHDPDYPVPTTEEKAGDRVVWTLSTRLAPPARRGR